MNRDTRKESRTAARLVRPGAYLYSEVARELRERIKNNVYAPGSKLPSMSELCTDFNVSAITLRNALRELTQEGLISGHQGLGIFVKKRGHIHRVFAGNPKHSIGDEITRAGYRARIEELSYAEIRADSEIADRLQIRCGTRLFRHEKMTYADDEPVAFHVVIMSRDLARRLRADLAQQFLFRVLAEHGLAGANLRCEFSALSLSETQAHRFYLPPGYPMLQVRYLPINADGKPILFGLTIARSDRFVFEVDLPGKKDV